MLFLLKGI